MGRETLIQVRKDTSARWSAVNPILAAGEPGYDTTTGTLKIGDGVTPWTSLGRVWQGAYPVGSVYITMESTDPATTLGFGTWTQIGAGRVLVGQDTGDVDFDVIGETGGSKTV